MTAEPVDTFTSEQAYELMLEGAIIQIQEMASNICSKAAVWLNGHRYPITDPEDIYTWLCMDLQAGTVRRLPGKKSDGEANRWQHVMLLPLAQEAKKA